MEEEHSFADLNYETGSYSLMEIIQKFPLPVVVFCDASNSALPVDKTRFNLDLRQPLLLYRNRNIRKVSARSVHIDPATRAFQDVGEPLLIPEDYKGYFSLLKKNYNNGPVDDFVPHYQEILEVADTNTETFLIGGERRVQALQIVRRENGSIIHQQRTLFPGDVLRKGKIYIGEKRRKSKLFRKTKVVTEKYLLCTDDADREILLPFDQKGLFYTLSTNSGDANRPVMQMSDVVNKKCFPCIVRLVYGRIPNTPCSFTGTLRLERADLEQSVIAATLVNTRNILLEIPTSCDLRFNVAVSNDDLFHMPSYHQALELCNEKGSIYMRNIKVCHTIDSDTHNKCPFNLPMEHSETTEAVKRRRDLSMQLSVGTDVSEENSLGSQSRADRTSDYAEMRSVKSDSLTEDSMDEELNGFSVFSKEINYNDEIPPPCTCTPKFTNPSYMENSGESQSESTKETNPVLQIFLDNKLFSVEIGTNESSTDPSGELIEPKQPQNQEPAPKPCIGCGGDLDSGIQMELDGQGGRRPSTHVFSEVAHSHSVEDDVTYDVPRLATRRVSAPPGCSAASSFAENNIASPKEVFNRRSSTSPRRPPPPLPTSNEATADFSTIEFAIEEYDSEEDYTEPLYQNIAGSQTNLEEMCRHRGNNSRHTPASSRCSSTRDSGHLSDECLPCPSSRNYDRDQLSPNIFKSVPIGEIPNLPRSRRNSISPSIDDYQNSPMKVPALPASKGIRGNNRCDSPLSVDSTKDRGQNGSNEENNNDSKSSDVDLARAESPRINPEDFDKTLQLNIAEQENVVTKESRVQAGSEESHEELCLENGENGSRERNYSVSSSQSIDASDDNIDGNEEKQVSRRYGSKIRPEKKKSRQSKDVSKMSAEELAIEFRRVGIKQTTIELVLSLNLNGIALLEKYHNHDTIGDFLPSAGLIDQQKISLFIQGCKY